MRYRVEGNTLPVAILQLEAGESIISEAGGRTWSRGMIETETQARGGAAKSIGRMFAGESLFMSKYTAKAPAEIAFASHWLKSPLISMDISSPTYTRPSAPLYFLIYS